MYNDNSWNSSSRGRQFTNNEEGRPSFRSNSFDGERRPRPNFDGERRQRPNFDGERRPRFQSRPDAPMGGRPRFSRGNDTIRSSADGIRVERQEAGFNTAQSGRRRQRIARPATRPVHTSGVNVYSQKKQLAYNVLHEDPTKPIRLNKFLANAGVCSRREADDFIQAGVISVNGEVITELGAKILPTDKVMFHDQPVRRENKVYILLNKPKNTVTTTDDPEERHTVLDIVRNACAERIYPVGRLDRNTTGVLLLTNDGDLAAKLTHPKFNKRKIYAATLDKDLTDEARDTLLAGVTLDDELIVPDALEFTKQDDRKHIGLTIHSGQNRVVRRLFEKIGYKVMQLDRVSFAGLTKKNLGRGKYRFLTQREVAFLQMGSFD